jgi:hypothetical protein
LLDRKLFTQKGTGITMRLSSLNGRLKHTVKNQIIKIQIILTKMIGWKLQDLCQVEMIHSVNLNLIKIKNLEIIK